MPNCDGSLWIIYLASKKIGNNFATIGFIEGMKQEGVEQYKKINMNELLKPVVGILSLYCILHMEDNHADNIGVDEDNSPFILDFCFRPINSFDIERDFRDRVETRSGEELEIK